MDSSSLRTGSRRDGPRLHPRHRRRRRQVGEAPGPGCDPFPAGAERLPAHWPRQVDLPELRGRGGVRGDLQPAVRRHQPAKEEVEYVDSIKADVRWLGFDWGERLFYASDYFEQLYAYAVHLIENGKAYVDSLTADEMREYRGTLMQAGTDSPYRARSVAENLDMFARMRAGEFPDGAHVLRAKIDMGSPNINMRDPVLYRIRRAHHHRTGDAWCIYPMYDFAHPPSDALELITHSLCTLEFEDHRPLYDWLIDNLPVPSKPQQIEFARLNLTYTVMSKRKLLELVQEGHVAGWDDPRMPTIVGMRRRGYTPAAIRNFCDRIGVAKRENIVDVAVLEHAVREDLNRYAPRVMAVLNPVRVVIDNYPAGRPRSSRSRSTRRIRPRAAGRCRSRASCGSSAMTFARIRRRSSSGCHRARKCGCAAPTS